MSATNKEGTSSASTTASSLKLRRTGEWAFALEIPSDVTVEIQGLQFALHKFPLVSRSGWMRKLVADANDSSLSRIELPNIPGGADAFELVARFCYGITIDINKDNVAMLRCAAEYLEMSEDYGRGNLIDRTEEYLKTVLMDSLTTAVAVLQSCERLLPMAEELNIVDKCIEAAAQMARREEGIGRNSSNFRYGGIIDGKSRNFESARNSPTTKKMDGKSRNFESARNSPATKKSWTETLSVLRIDFFQRLIAALRAHGLRYDMLARAVVHYAEKSLKQLGNERDKLKFTYVEHEQRVLVETIVSMLPPEPNTISISFLFEMLRVAIHLDTTLACRLDLEQRIGVQLEQASVQDLLIPSLSYTSDTIYDVDTVRRIVVNFLERNDRDSDASPVFYELDNKGFPSQSTITKVARLLDSYLAEVASDANLTVDKFIGLAQLLPGHARTLDDGLYRAIDIYLKAHPTSNGIERKNVCSVIDWQKLSQEACTHAAQNERLPVHLIVQVLYFEQMRLRDSMVTSHGRDGDSPSGWPLSDRTISAAVSTAISPRQEEVDYAALYHENKELKLELAHIKSRLNNLENAKGLNSEKQVKVKSPSVKKDNFFRSFSKKISKLNLLQRNSPKGLAVIESPDLLTPKRRRNSMS